MRRAGRPVSPGPWLLLRAGGHLGLPSLKESEGPQCRLGPSAWRRESLLLAHHWASRPFSCPPRPPSLEAHVTLRAQTLPSRLCSSQPQASRRPWALTTSSPLPSAPPPACILGDSHLCTQHPSGTRALSAGAGPPSLPQPPGSPSLAPAPPAPGPTCPPARPGPSDLHPTSVSSWHQLWCRSVVLLQTSSAALHSVAPTWLIKDPLTWDLFAHLGHTTALSGAAQSLPRI